MCSITSVIDNYLRIGDKYTVNALGRSFKDLILTIACLDSLPPIWPLQYAYPKADLEQQVQFTL